LNSCFCGTAEETKYILRLSKQNRTKYETERKINKDYFEKKKLDI